MIVWDPREKKLGCMQAGAHLLSWLTCATPSHTNFEAPFSISHQISHENIAMQLYMSLLIMQITKQEAFGPGESSSIHAYPPKYILEIRPLENAEQRRLYASLELNGTDDQRKFTLTNPPIAPPPGINSNLEAERSMYM